MMVLENVKGCKVADKDGFAPADHLNTCLDDLSSRTLAHKSIMLDHNVWVENGRDRRHYSKTLFLFLHRCVGVWHRSDSV